MKLQSESALRSAEHELWARSGEALGEDEANLLLGEFTAWRQSANGERRTLTRPLPAIAGNIDMRRFQPIGLSRSGEAPFQRIDLDIGPEIRPPDVVPMVRAELAIYERFSDRFSYREFQVLQHLCSHQKTIARALRIDSSTVRTYMQDLGEKLGTNSHCELIPAAMHEGLTPITPLTDVERRRLGGLNQREREIAAHSVWSYRAIAERFGVSLSTVRTSLNDTYTKTAVQSKAELVGLMMRAYYEQDYEQKHDDTPEHAVD